jgi:hypothetical protein
VKGHPLAPGAVSLCAAGLLSGGERLAAGPTLKVSGPGGVRPLAKGFYASADPVVSYDGQRVHFAGKLRRKDTWQAWEAALEGRAAHRYALPTPQGISSDAGFFGMDGPSSQLRIPSGAVARRNSTPVTATAAAWKLFAAAMAGTAGGCAATLQRRAAVRSRLLAGSFHFFIRLGDLTRLSR